MAHTSSTRQVQLKRLGLLLGLAFLLAGQAGIAQQAGTERLVITAGRSMVLVTDFDIVRFSITDPEVADASVVQPREVLIDGRAPGTISMILWGPGVRRQYDIVVEPGISTLEQQLRALFPGEDIRLSYSNEALVLSGQVSNTDVMLRVGEIATASSSDTRIINLLQVPGGDISQQVMLQVRFAEINRSRLYEAGLAFFTNDRFLARTTTQQFASPDFEGGDTGGVELVFSDYLNLFLFDRKEGIGAAMRLLQEEGAFRSLAEPNLIAYNGQEASFLAGGEFPVPIVQGATGTVSVQFKEFGVRLTFTPTIAGDVIRLKVAPEVSALDFNNGITLSGFRIPALITRRASTDVELRDGQSFAIAGLLNNIGQNDAANVPFFSSIPIIGAMFKSKAERSEETELMVLITPRLVKPLEPDEVPPLPTDDVTIDSFDPTAENLGEQFEDAGLVDAPALANQGGNQ